MMAQRTRISIPLVFGLVLAAWFAAGPAAAQVCGGAAPCSCGDTVLDSRVLTSLDDPVVQADCPGDGLVIGANGVTLDLNGNMIRGTGGGTGVTISPGVSGAVVRGGRVARFGTGVLATSTTGTTVVFVEVRNNQTGLHLVGSSNTVDSVTAELNGTGIVVLGDDATITRSRAVKGGGDGIRVMGAGAWVERNVVQRNTGIGLQVDGTGALVERNPIASNGSNGLVVSGTGHTVSRNTLKLNGGNGIATGATGSTFDRNTTDRNGGTGIVDSTSGGGTAGTASVYTRNRCENDAGGDSSPAGLCL
jgi:hypothetical protein